MSLAGSEPRTAAFPAKLRMVLDYVPCDACLTVPSPEQDLLCGMCARLDRVVAAKAIRRRAVLVEAPAVVPPPVVEITPPVAAPAPVPVPAAAVAEAPAGLHPTVVAPEAWKVPAQPPTEIPARPSEGEEAAPAPSTPEPVEAPVVETLPPPPPPQAVEREAPPPPLPEDEPAFDYDPPASPPPPEAEEAEEEWDVGFGVTDELPEDVFALAPGGDEAPRRAPAAQPGVPPARRPPAEPARAAEPGPADAFTLRPARRDEEEFSQRSADERPADEIPAAAEAAWSDRPRPLSDDEWVSPSAAPRPAREEPWPDEAPPFEPPAAPVPESTSAPGEAPWPEESSVPTEVAEPVAEAEILETETIEETQPIPDGDALLGEPAGSDGDEEILETEIVEMEILTDDEPEPAAAAPATPAPRASEPDSAPVADDASASLTILEGVGAMYANRLGEAGVRAVRDLVGRDAWDLAEGTGISAKLLERWIAAAELMEGARIPRPYAELLVRSGVRSLETLRGANPMQLAGEVNALLPGASGEGLRELTDEDVRAWQRR